MVIPKYGLVFINLKKDKCTLWNHLFMIPHSQVAWGHFGYTIVCTTTQPGESKKVGRPGGALALSCPKCAFTTTQGATGIQGHQGANVPCSMAPEAVMAPPATYPGRGIGGRQGLVTCRRRIDLQVTRPSSGRLMPCPTVKAGGINAQRPLRCPKAVPHGGMAMQSPHWHPLRGTHASALQGVFVETCQLGRLDYFLLTQTQLDQ
ncbi:hypothetical protein PGTUg99_033362 [Puccinia graminis f. sp. tritici]|uniref:Uncharacterized protein n=1 Tax=Puccinia graminis f. sp. tritici TaxID=56615 RepID=A0A5B0SF26_PUCGR|nr:hypothetical protein PGTUg99_033362 [Puccinia graminis f. sp. tritici]